LQLSVFTILAACNVVLYMKYVLYFYIILLLLLSLLFLLLLLQCIRHHIIWQWVRKKVSLLYSFWNKWL
jgi:hypothetical protein